MSLVQQPPVVEGLEDMPDRFDIVVGVGRIRMFGIQPETDAAVHLLPFRLTRENAVLALPHECFDAVFLDLLLAANVMSFLDLDLHGQTLAVPTALARNVVACACLVPQN